MDYWDTLDCAYDGLTYYEAGGEEPIDFSSWPDDAYGYYHYRSADGTCGFLFELAKIDGIVRAYIIEAPSYGSRADDGHSTHRVLPDDDDPYVCVKETLAPTNVPDCLSWAVYWAEQTTAYIHTGKRFS